MNQSETLNELATALVAAQKEMPGIDKDATGHGYKYASLDNIMAKVRPVLADHGLTIMQQPTSRDGSVMGLTTRLMHTSGQWIEETVYAPRDEGKRRNSVQAAGSTITYLRRYGIAALLGLADETDTDAAPNRSDRPDFEDLPQGKAGDDNGSEPAQNGGRPYEPQVVREKLRHRAAQYASHNDTASDKQRGLTTGMLEECFAGLEDSSDRRRSVLAYVFEVDSGNDLTDAQVLALLDWLAPEKDSGDAYRPGEYVSSEAGRIVKARMVEQGQDALFPEEEAA